MNQSSPISTVARLYEVLAHVKSFPTPIKPVAIISGADEAAIPELIAPSLYTVIDGHIQHTKAMKHLECVTIGDADMLYRSNGVATYVKDGRAAWLHVDGYEDGPFEGVGWRVWRLGLAMELSSRKFARSIDGLAGEIGESIERPLSSTGDREQCGKGLYQSLGRPDLDGADATPITAEALERFFEVTREKVRRREESTDHHTDS